MNKQPHQIYELIKLYHLGLLGQGAKGLGTLVGIERYKKERRLAKEIPIEAIWEDKKEQIVKQQVLIVY
jgi:hypothetical protein